MPTGQTNAVVATSVAKDSLLFLNHHHATDLNSVCTQEGARITLTNTAHGARLAAQNGSACGPGTPFQLCWWLDLPCTVSQHTRPWARARQVSCTVLQNARVNANYSLSLL